MIARYLIQRMGYGVSDALECVTIARGHPIERDNYISNLSRNVEQLPKIMDGKDIIRGRADGEPMRKGSKRPADKGKEHVNRHGPARDSYRGRDAWKGPSKTISPWEPGHGPQPAVGEPREEGLHRPRRSEFVDESQFQAAPGVGYWGGGVHHPPPYQPVPRPNEPPPSQFVVEGRRDYRDEGRGTALTGFNPMVPPPMSAFPQQRDSHVRAQQHEFNGRRPAHSEFIREEHHPWPPAVPQHGFEEHVPPRDYIPHHGGRHSPPPAWQGPPHQGRYSPPRHRMSPPRGRMSPHYGGRYPSRRTPPPHLRSPPRGHRMSPPRGHRMSPPHHGRRTSPPRRSPPHGHRISPPRGSPPRGYRLSPPHHGRRMSPPRSPSPGRRMSPLRGTRGLTPPPPPRSFRTPPPPTRQSPSPMISPPRRRGSPSRHGSPPRTFRPPSPRGGPLTPPFRSSHPVDHSLPHRMASAERRTSPSGRRKPSPMSRSSPARDDMSLPKYKGRRSSPRAQSGRPDHLDMKYGPEIEPFPLERSPPRSTGPSHSSRNRRSRSPLRRLDSGRKQSPPLRRTTPTSMRRSPPSKRSLSPGQPFHKTSGSREKGRRTPLPSGSGKFEKGEGRVEEARERSRHRESPSRFDRNAPQQDREWKELRDMKMDQYDNDGPIDYIDLRSSDSPPNIVDDYPPTKRSREVPRGSKAEIGPKRSRPRTPEIQDVPRRRGLRTPEPVEPRRRQRTPEPQIEARRGLIRSPEPLVEPRRVTVSPELQRRRVRTPERQEEPVGRRHSTPDSPGEPVRHRIRSPEEPRRRRLRSPERLEEPGRRELGSLEPREEYRRSLKPFAGEKIRVQRTPEPEEVPRRRPRSPAARGESARRGMRSPDPRETLGTPEPREDSVGRDPYESRPVLEPVEPYEDPRSYGVLRTPEPLEEEPRRRGPSERFERKDYHDDNPRYNRGGYSQGNRRPYNNYRGRMRGRGRISQGGPMRHDSHYGDRTIRKPYLDQPAPDLDDTSLEERRGYGPRRPRSKSPIVIAREVPVMNEVYVDEEPDCRELLIEKRTTVAAEIGALSPTALELIGPDDEILFIGSSSEQANSRSSSVRRRPVTSRLSPRLPCRLSRSPPPKKRVFERLDDNKPPVFERLDDPVPDPRPLMGVRPSGRFELRGSGRGQSYIGRGQPGHRPSRGIPSRPSSNIRETDGRAPMRGMRSPPHGSRASARGISLSRGKISSSRKILSSRGTASAKESSSSRVKILSSRGRAASASSKSEVTSSHATSSGNLVRPKKTPQSSESVRSAPKKSQVSSQSSSEGIRRPAKTAQPSGKTSQSAVKTGTTGKTVVKKVSTKVSAKVPAKVVPKATTKTSVIKKTRGAPRGRQ